MRRHIQLILLTTFAACAPAASDSTDTAADEQAIRGRVDGMNQALTSQNDSLIGMTYADSAVVMPPNMGRITGREGIRAYYANLWPTKASLVLDPGAIRINGDWATEEGNWTWSMPMGASTVSDHGKYLTTWHRAESGDWMIEQNIWNSDTPLSAAPAAMPARHR